MRSPDKGDALAIGREAGNGDLKAVEGGGGGAGIEDDGGGGVFVLEVQFGDPPIVLARGGGGDVGEGGFGGGPVELVDVEALGSDEAAGAVGGGKGDGVEALDLYVVVADDARPGSHGGERAGGAGGVFNEKEGDDLARGCKGDLLKKALKMGELAGFGL